MENSKLKFVLQKNRLPEKFETLEYERLQNGQIIHMKLNRPSKRNALSLKMFDEILEFFSKADNEEDLRCIVVTGNGLMFCAGLDLKDASQSLFSFDSDQDLARKAIAFTKTIEDLQRPLRAIELCRVPVLFGIHERCIGGGLDMCLAGDVTYCTQDAQFIVKEIDIGMAADIGSLQRLPFYINNSNELFEFVYTGKPMRSEEARKYGIVGKVFKTKEEMTSELLGLAKVIASKSPVAVWTLKRSLHHHKDASIEKGLNHIKMLNRSSLVTEDIIKAISSPTPVFPKLQLK